MRVDELARLRAELVGFTARMLPGTLPPGHRLTGELYVRGLLTDGTRKSMRPMALRLGIDHQRLQQFITSAAWDHRQVRANVARWAARTLRPGAYVVRESGFPKHGTASPCVARQYSAALGTTGNCQVGIAVHVATDRASLAANWRLFCPASWDDSTLAETTAAERVRHRRDRAGIPGDVRYRERWRLALDMIDEMTGAWGLPELPVVADSSLGDATPFRLGLDRRGLCYVVRIDPRASVRTDLPPVSRPGTPRELALAVGQRGLHPVTWRRRTDGDAAPARSRFLAIRVGTVDRRRPSGTQPTPPDRWLIAHWPPGTAEPVAYWLSNLDPRTPRRTLVRLAMVCWRVEHDGPELGNALGLAHFEGRSFLGWHRHATLAALAQAFRIHVSLECRAGHPGAAAAR